MMNMTKGSSSCLLMLFLPFIGLFCLVAGAFQQSATAQVFYCAAPATTQTTSTPATRQATITNATPTGQAGATSTVDAVDAESTCYSPNSYAADVVALAKQMADALCANFRCDPCRINCTYKWYNPKTFPPEVIAYGQKVCQQANEGDCPEWSNGLYQCVSFVRGAYSQIYPMTATANAFDLWATYQKKKGWQEIPSLATPRREERFLPEPGDIMVMKDSFVGHVAIVLAVQAPGDKTNGSISFANANSTSPYDSFPLHPDLTVDTSSWTLLKNSEVWGYIRPSTSSATPTPTLSMTPTATHMGPSNKFWSFLFPMALAKKEWWSQ